MWTKVMSRKPQTDDQALVPEYALVIAKDWICKLRVEGGERLGFLFAGLDYGDMDGVIGVAGPYIERLRQLKDPREERDNYAYHIHSSPLSMLLGSFAPMTVLNLDGKQGMEMVS